MRAWLDRVLLAVLPAPLITLALLIAWLMLNQSISAGNLLLGFAFGVAIPWFSERMRPDKPYLAAWGTTLRLGFVVLRDIVMSNIDVAKRVLGPEAAIQSRFVWVPLDIRDPHGIVALAGIITMTPGTLSSDLSEDRRHLLVHALHCEDEAALVADIKARYEAPLIRIFES
jgi:multicomponent K+:H+ antiporter subunit E